MIMKAENHVGGYKSNLFCVIYAQLGTHTRKNFFTLSFTLVPSSSEAMYAAWFPMALADAGSTAA